MKHKTHSNAFGENLPDETRRELYALTKPPTEAEKEAGRPWLRDFRRDVVPHLKKAGIAAPGMTAWYRFLGRMRLEEAAQIAISVETAKRIAQGVVRADVDPKLAAEMFTGLSVDAATQGNDEAAKMLADSAAKYHAAALGAEKLKLDAARQRTAEESLRLSREKFEFDAAKAAMEQAAKIKGIAGDDSLGADEKIARVRAALFGV